MIPDPVYPYKWGWVWEPYKWPKNSMGNWGEIFTPKYVELFISPMYNDRRSSPPCGAEGNGAMD